MSGQNNNDPNDTEEVLEPNARNIILSIIGQLSKGSDLHRVSLPTFVLEPRSFLERITDFMSHPEILLEAHKLPTPEERMIAITKYYFSGWHIRPKGVRKPYNPVLGEYFRCKWKFENGTEAYYISEQISHHPPISAYVFASPENKFIIQGEMRPKSKFYGTSAATHLEGTASIKFLDHPGEEYIITYPSIYVYGILFGKLTYDLGDVATISCDKTDLSCRAEFKTKGIFSGSYNTISGKIKKTSTGEALYDFSGKWSEKIYMKGKSGPESVFFDAVTAQKHPKDVAPEDAQDPFESRRLWKNVTDNLKSKNIDAATEEKNIIEQDQRDETRIREEKGQKHSHRFFDVTDSGSTWKLKDLSNDPLKAKVEIDNFIFKYDPTATI